MVYDLDNNQISLAQTQFNATTSNVEEINLGANGVPGATLVASAIATAALSTGQGGPIVTPFVSSPVHKGAAAAATPPPLAYQNIMLGAAAGLAMVL